MVGSAPSIRPSSRMVSIFSRWFEYVTVPPVRFPTGLPARLIEALELADAAEGQAGRRAALGGAEAVLALRDGADCGGRGTSVNSSAIELSLTPACTKNAGTFAMPTSIV